MTSSGVLSIRNGELGYPGRKVLSGLNLVFEAPRIHCVFGRNGCGKTTLLHSLAGLNKPVSGEVKLDDIQVHDMTPVKRAKRIASVFTQRPYVSGMTVLDFVHFGRYPYTNWLGMGQETDAKKVGQALAQCALQPFKYRLINELSDGEMQQVQIARALAQDVDILLLDEPVTHLDLANKSTIFRILKEVAQAGQTVIFTSHDLLFSVQLAEVFTVISAGSAKQMTRQDFQDSGIHRDIFDSDLIDVDLRKNSITFRSS